MSDLIHEGDAALIVIRANLVAGNVSLQFRSNLWKCLSYVFNALAGESTGLLLLESFPSVDSLPDNSVRASHEPMFALFVQTISIHPTSNIVTQVKHLLRNSRRVLVRVYLVKLAGSLLAFDPTLRQDLAALMRGDPESQVRTEAAEALAKVNPRESSTEYLQALSEMFGSSSPQSPPELMAVIRNLAKSMRLEEILAMLGESIDKAPVNVNVILAGMQLGMSYVANDVGTLDELYFKLSSQSSSNMQVLALSAIQVSMQRGPDPRAFDVAMQTFNATQDYEMRDMALRTAMQHVTDENSALATVDRVLSSQPKLADTAAEALTGFAFRHPESSAAFERTKAYALEGDKERRLQFIRNMACPKQARNPFASLLQQLAETDPDQTIRETAKSALESDPSDQSPARKRFGIR